jgi:hypothetical protein
MMSKRGKITIYLLAAALCVLTIGFFGVLAAEKYDPTTFEVGLHRTDLLMDAGGLTPMSVFDGAGTAVTVDLVSNPGDVFGEGDVPVGTYNRMVLTMANLVSVAGTDPCDDISAYAGTFRIDDGLAPDAHVEVYFATADDGGNSMILADGSAGAPFLMMNPIVVQASETTVVRLAFYTSGSLVCVGGVDQGLRPPAISVANYIEGELQVVNPEGVYWFSHFNLNAQLFNESTGDWLVLEGPGAVSTDELLNRMLASTGWGSLTLNAPDAVTGVGSWEIINASWRSGGFGDHRHNFARWDTSSDEGYAETAVDLPYQGTYQLTGNHIFLKLGGSAAMEGYIADDGRSFIMVNLAGVDDSDVVFAVKKASGFPSDLPTGTFVIVSPQIDFRYDTSGSSPYPATDVDFNGEVVIIRGGATDDFFSWHTNLGLEYDYGGGSTIQDVYGQMPLEDSSYETGISSLLSFNGSGFATTAPDDNEIFLAMGGDDTTGYLGVFAGQGAEEAEGEHRLNNGFIIEADPSPTQADLAGRWALMGINWEGNEGGDGTWYTGDEDYKLSNNIGLIEFDGSGGITWNFTDKDIITQAISSEIGSGNVTVATEYYEVGNPLGNPSGTAIPLPLFNVTEPSVSSTVVAKIVLDKGGNTILFWSPLDSDNVPDVNSSANAANRFSMGAAVKIE